MRIFLRFCPLYTGLWIKIRDPSVCIFLLEFQCEHIKCVIDDHYTQYNTTEKFRLLRESIGDGTCLGPLANVVCCKYKSKG